jgi:hypothetical protein
MFYSTLGYHTLLHKMLVLSPMALHILTHPSSELLVLGMLGMHIDVAISDS